MSVYDTDPRKAEWHRIMVERGHEPIMDTYYDTPELDVWVVGEGFHNGPGCSRCRWSCCWHCEEDPLTAIPKECCT